MKVVVRDTDDFESREKSEAKAFSQFLDNQGSDARKKSKTFKSNFLHNIEAFGWDRDGKHQTCSYGSLRVSISK